METCIVDHHDLELPRPVVGELLQVPLKGQGTHALDLTDQRVPIDGGIAAVQIGVLELLLEIRDGGHAPCRYHASQMGDEPKARLVLEVEVETGIPIFI